NFTEMETALIIIDIQNDYFDNGAMALVNAESASKNAKLIIDRFRINRKPVVHIQHITLEKNKSYLLPNTHGSEIHLDVKPIGGEKVIKKYFPNGFKRTDLLDFLNSNKIKELVICGMMTHMCVDTTVRAAKDLGFNITLIGDACATRDLEINGQKVIAKDVQKSFLAALNGYFSVVKTTEQYLNE
ncbi:MAG: cysteine hydrolase family protein, partial [Bacteroidales bacterium]